LLRGHGWFVSWRRAHPRHIRGNRRVRRQISIVVIAAWLIAGFAVPKFLPSLSSVTQGNNSAFLPANAPSEQAAQLAAPFGSTNLIPVPVVAAASQGTLAAADVTWLTGLQHDLGSVKTVVAVRDLGRSADQQAEQLQVLSNVGGGGSAGSGRSQAARRSGRRRWPGGPGGEGAEQDTESAAPRAR
jgi:uncharacterized membrane protein YdfJ with MMPL/SSD domain